VIDLEAARITPQRAPAASPARSTAGCTSRVPV